MEGLTDLFGGIVGALSLTNLLACLFGCLIGTLIGVLPGIGPAATIALLLPVTFALTPVASLIMLCGIFYGAMYGGSTTAILVNIPGEAASAVTCIDGYQMARQGRAGPALGIAAFGSFIAGIVTSVLLILVAPPISAFALKFGPPEIFALMVFGLTMVSYLSSGALVKAFISAICGLLLGTVGIDISGAQRFTLNIPEFYDGIGLIPLLMGLFGISEVLLNLERVVTQSVLSTKIAGLLPSKNDWKLSIGPIARGTGIGFACGILPGPGNTIASFVSYAVEKRISKTPQRFGRGAIEGVAGPESANNAACAGNLIPLLTLGIPTSPIMAIIMAALIVHGITPGPLFMKNNQDLFWTLIGSLFIGNLMLLVLSLPLIGIWVRILRVPYNILCPLILIFCLIGAYGTESSMFGIYEMLFFGVLGYLMKKTGFEPAPMVMAFVLCPFLEEAFRQSLIQSKGSFSIFVGSWISLSILTIAVVFVAFGILAATKDKRSKLVEEINEK